MPMIANEIDNGNDYVIEGYHLAPGKELQTKNGCHKTGVFRFWCGDGWSAAVGLLDQAVKKELATD